MTTPRGSPPEKRVSQSPRETAWQRFKRWCDYWCFGPFHARRLVRREWRRYATRWLSREVFRVACDRCHTVRKYSQRKLPESGQLVCPTCKNEFDIAEIRAFLNLRDTGESRERARTFHKPLFYDPKLEQDREFGL